MQKKPWISCPVRHVGRGVLFREIDMSSPLWIVQKTQPSWRFGGRSRGLDAREDALHSCRLNEHWAQGGNRMAASSFEFLDKRFRRLFVANAEVDKLYTGCRWAEGPAYFAAGQYLIWSDIPNNR